MGTERLSNGNLVMTLEGGEAVVLTEKAFDQFVSTIENPAPATPALKLAFSKLRATHGDEE